MMKRIFLAMILCAASSWLIAQKASYQIGVLIDEENVITQSLLDNLQQQIKAVVGEDAEVNFPTDYLLTSNFDHELSRKNYQQLLESEADMILALGPISYASVSRSDDMPKPTFTFSYLPKEILAVGNNSNRPDLPNLYTVLESKSIEGDIKAFREVVHSHRIGIIAEQAIFESFPFEKVFDESMAALEMDYRFIDLESVLEKTADLQGLDAVYLVGGPFLTDTEARSLAENLMKAGLPSFTRQGYSQLENGLMMTHTPVDKEELISRRISSAIEQYINGRTLSEIPAKLDYPTQLSLNYSTSEQIGVPFKMSFVKDMNFISGQQIIDQAYQQDLTTIVRQVLNQNLELKTAQQNVLIQKEEVKIAKSAYLPRLNAALNSVHTEGDFASFGFGQSPEFMTFG
ncbi:MAG: TolC family protein, partial [Bacteroidota bacterium]